MESEFYALVWPPLTACEIGPHQGVIQAVQIRPNGQILYEVAFWSQKELKQEWYYEYAVTSHAAKDKIGYKPGKSV